MIPVGYAPSSVVLDTTDNALLVANDKGIGTTGYGVAPPPKNTAENSYGTAHGVTAFNTHQDLGTVSVVPIPNSGTLATFTTQVFKNNHWDLAENIWSAAGGSPSAKPAVIPARIGDPSKIKHVFLIIRENRTYDQMLGDVEGGNGDPTLAVFGDASTFAAYPVTPNAHTMVERFPLLDNFYDPSRQSADGHNWILQAMAPYSDDIQSPDWLRDYPSNGGDGIAYQKKGHLFDVAAAAGIKMKNYGEYVEYNTFTVPGCTPTKIRPKTLPLMVPFHPLRCRLLFRTAASRPGRSSTTTHYSTRAAWSRSSSTTTRSVVLPIAEPDEVHSPELPTVRSRHPRPVPRGCLAAGLQQGRGRGYGTPVGASSGS